MQDYEYLLFGNTASRVLDIEARGTNFVLRGTDTVYKLRGITAFDALQRVLNEELVHLQRYIDFSRSIGVTEWATFGCWSRTNFRYQDYAWAEMRDALETLA